MSNIKNLAVSEISTMSLTERNIGFYTNEINEPEQNWCINEIDLSKHTPLMSISPRTKKEDGQWVCLGQITVGIEHFVEHNNCYIPR